MRSSHRIIYGNSLFRLFGFKIEEPTDKDNLKEMLVRIGDYAEQERVFTKQDLMMFSEAI